MIHSFDTDEAFRYGIRAAVLLNHFRFWIAKNQANKKHHHKDRTWTYNSITAYAELFPYMTPKQIRVTLDYLVEQKVLRIGSFHENKFDRTLWYALEKEPVGSICPTGQIESPDSGKSTCPTGQISFAPQGKSLISKIPVTPSSKRKKGSATAPTLFVIPSEMLPPPLNRPDIQDLWDAWQEHIRQKMRGRKMTEEAARRQVSQMRKWGADRSAAALEHSIQNNYHGLYEPHGAKTAGGAPRAENRLEERHRGERDMNTDPIIGDPISLQVQVEKWKETNAAHERGGNTAKGVNRRAGRDALDLRSAIQEWLKKRGVTKEMIEEGERMIAEVDAADRIALREKNEKGKWARLCPERYRHPFDIQKVPAPVSRESIKSVLSWEYGPQGLYIIGESGMAKTMTAFALLHRLVIRERRTAIVLDGIKFATLCTDAFRESSLYDRTFNALERCEILFIDDLAKRFTPATQQGLFTVIEGRTSAERPTFITTNCTGEQLAEKIGDDSLSDPLRRRLRDYCTSYRF